MTKTTFPIVVAVALCFNVALGGSSTPAVACVEDATSTAAGGTCGNIEIESGPSIAMAVNWQANNFEQCALGSQFFNFLDCGSSEVNKCLNCATLTSQDFIDLRDALAGSGLPCTAILGGGCTVASGASAQVAAAAADKCTELQAAEDLLLIDEVLPCSAGKDAVNSLLIVGAMLFTLLSPFH